MVKCEIGPSNYSDSLKKQEFHILKFGTQTIPHSETFSHACQSTRRNSGTRHHNTRTTTTTTKASQTGLNEHKQLQKSLVLMLLLLLLQLLLFLCSMCPLLHTLFAVVRSASSNNNSHSLARYELISGSGIVYQTIFRM